MRNIGSVEKVEFCLLRRFIHILCTLLLHSCDSRDVSHYNSRVQSVFKPLNRLDLIVLHKVTWPTKRNSGGSILLQKYIAFFLLAIKFSSPWVRAARAMERFSDQVENLDEGMSSLLMCYWSSLSIHHLHACMSTATKDNTEDVGCERRQLERALGLTKMELAGCRHRGAKLLRFKYAHLWNSLTLESAQW